ncbi:MAG: 2-oxoacid:ferredoxin oxidoreductase subunit gamma [Proteobacteria bacterium]|nr:2-oxoacid:ferredoxin oxidoreductase subunit gamma [Pseudomonadota bacterium]NIS71691.1 2-oxoacid:ferredoxin oxidoreductase subunit gamma [Pseudomonadota bacterium]
MLIKAVFSGFGGQGVLMMGYVLAVAGMRDGKNVTYLPAYGAEVRGGTANCTVAIADEEIASPVASSPEFVVVMNKPSLSRFQNVIQSGGGLFINSSMVDTRPVRGDIEIFEVPANDLAKDLGNGRLTNMIMLGAFVRKTGMASLGTTEQAVQEIFEEKGKSIVKQNKRALKAGYDYMG